MPKRMLIDAAHPEETRVVVTSGTRLEEFDFESSTKKQVKGNIYLAKVTRVEPSLQAAFVDYGGNRHGFLAFSEIHPDYYRIPVSDRRSTDAEPWAGNGHLSDDAGDEAGVPLALAVPAPVAVPPDTADDEAASDEAPPLAGEDAGAAHDDVDQPALADEAAAPVEDVGWVYAPGMGPQAAMMEYDAAALRPSDEATAPATGHTEFPDQLIPEPDAIALRAAEDALLAAELGELPGASRYENGEADMTAPEAAEHESIETLGGDEVEEVEEADAERRRWHPSRHYKIQEVIKRRQIMLVQVAKEERGNKGAALTTYLSLAGRYCVLMPNTNRGGGVSRKINSLTDRRRLKEILEELDIPEGMGVIVRTAGAERSKAEVKRDYEYLLRLWNEIRDLTLKSTAPALIYEEGNLIKRSIRDLYTRDIDEVLVEGEDGYKTAKAFMRTLMPSHAKRVQPYRDPQIGLFHKFQIESQIDAVHSPVAQLRSGGYIVINQTEALVAIDVNSGRATRERNIEETATRTNLEAADEIARQLRLRDLAGLIVTDFIDMEEHRNQVAVERRMKEALKNDRARIQVGRISPFGLLEMSRQRLRPSLTEASTEPCPHCGGTGFIRSVESTALYVLRSIEEEGSRRRSAEISLYVPTNVALYILNQKRESLGQIEARYSIKVLVARDDTLIPPNFRLERLRTYDAGEAPPLRPIQAPTVSDDDDDDVEIAADAEDDEVFDTTEATGREASGREATGRKAPARKAPAAAANGEVDGEEERAPRRRRRRRRRPDEPREARAKAATAAEETAGAEPAGAKPAPDDEERERDAEAERRRRRRGRRGGRARPRREEDGEAASPAAAAAAPDIAAALDAEEGAAVTTAGQEEPAELVWVEPTGGNATDAPASPAWPIASWIETADPAPHGDENPDEAVHHHEPEIVAVPPVAEPAPTVETIAGIPFASEAELVLEAAEAHPPAASDAAAAEAAAEVLGPDDGAPSRRPPQEAGHEEDVLTVADKPANPRRGWWQRLIQP